MSNKDDGHERELYYQELAEMDRPQTEVEFLLIKIEELESRLKEAELCLECIYNIDAKYIGTTKEDSVTVDELYNDILDKCEDYFKKYGGFK